MNLKVLSWNIWMDGYFDQISDFLKKTNADIICLQEVKDDDPKRDVIGYLHGLGYQHVFSPVEKKWDQEIFRDGPAIFSKYKIIKSQIYVLSKIDSRVGLRADIQVEDKVLHIFSTHLVHTHQKESKIQNEQSSNLIKVLPHERTILMGDFNATPNSQTIKNLQEVLIDCDQRSTPTWSVYPEGCETCNPQGISMRLDYIFTSKDIAVKSFEVVNSKGSDHLPISAVISL